MHVIRIQLTFERSQHGARADCKVFVRELVVENIFREMSNCLSRRLVYYAFFKVLLTELRNCDGSLTNLNTRFGVFIHRSCAMLNI